MATTTASSSQLLAGVVSGNSATLTSKHVLKQIVLSTPQFAGLRKLNNGLSRECRDAALGDFRQISAGKIGSTRGLVTAMAGSGKFFVGGNWKCNGDKASVTQLVEALNEETLEDEVDVIVAPPSVYIDHVVKTITNRIQVSGQNSWVSKGGAFTGEISVEMLKDLGATWVILGHSERRHIIGESNEFVGKKSAYALEQSLGVIGCVGELEKERDAGETFDVVFKQLKAFADHVPSWDNVVVAYEPVWAIGTGKVASPEQAQEVHAAIRKWLGENISPEVASKTRIIYGGSVNSKNCVELAGQEDIDGFLVGGASLKGPEFASICNSVTAKKVAV